MKPQRVYGGMIAAAMAATIVMTGCSSGAETIQISGSATVAPITQAVATQGSFAVDVSTEGTGEGFARFCAGETVINNASTPIPGSGDDVDYVEMCAQNGVEFIELPIGLDALSIVRNEANTFAQDLSLEQLAEIWGPDSEVTNWSDVDPSWPDEQIGLYGRPAGSGTFDVFTRTVNGAVGVIREDYETTNDLEELARWIAEDPHGLGFMGVGNYLAADEEYRDHITNSSVNGVAPALDEVQAGHYDVFTRPLFIYVSVTALDDGDVVDFVEYYLDEAEQVLPRVYFYALPSEAYPLVRERLDNRTVGTLYEDSADRDVPVTELLGLN